jgi:lysophospholipase
MAYPDILTPPDLAQRFLKPAGFSFASLETPRGDLRVGYARPAYAPRGTIIILPGLSEFIEKYYETARNILDQNYAVIILDWAGQGCSPRSIQKLPQRRHITSLDPDVADVERLFNSGLIGTFNGPFHILAHSMGGLITLLTATKTGFNLPITSAVITSPLLGIPQFSGPLSLITKPLLFTLNLIAPDSYVPGGHDWHEKHRSPPGAAIFTSDPERDAMATAWFKANPCLQVGSATNGWLSAVLKSVAEFTDPDRTRLLRIPTLILQAGDEKLVDNRGVAMFKDHPLVKIDTIPGARHEILMERDELRNAALNAFFAWIDRTAGLQVNAANQELINLADGATPRGGCCGGGCGCHR